jgi:glutamate/tyrosine decarboxylase-like PLP-dependent enzyme
MPDPLLSRAREHAESFLAGLDARPVYPAATFKELLEELGHPLQRQSLDPVAVIDELVAIASRGIVATAGPRYFGFVTGGTLPAALAADWLTTAWDQNAALHVMSPAAAAVEQVAARWLLEVLGLPPTSSVGLVTGATMANVTCLAAARHEVLRREGWDVEAHGLQGAPRITVVAGAEAHSSIRSALRLIGLGASTVVPVEADEQGRMRPDALRSGISAVSGPLIVCAQSGNVNTGAFDPLGEIEPIVRERAGWLHIDGAFGLWAAACPSLRRHVHGAAAADSWAIDGHKWLNVPYDCGFAIVAHPAAHAAAMSQSAVYLIRAGDQERDGMDWTPEASRRARGFAVYAALRSLGTGGLEELILRCCRCAARMADRLRKEAGVEILNDVVLNQVLVRFRGPTGANVTDAVARRVQRAGVCWAGGTAWRGEPALRISVSGWRTSEGDADRSADAILSALEACR